MGFFESLGRKVSAIHTVGGKVLDSIQHVGAKVSGFADKVSSVAAKAAPVLTMVSPTLGGIAGMVAAGSKAVSIAARGSSAVAKSLQSGNLVGAGIAANSARQEFINR